MLKRLPALTKRQVAVAPVPRQSLRPLAHLARRFHHPNRTATPSAPSMNWYVNFQLSSIFQALGFVFKEVSLTRPTGHGLLHATTTPSISPISRYQQFPARRTNAPATKLAARSSSMTSSLPTAPWPSPTRPASPRSAPSSFPLISISPTSPPSATKTVPIHSSPALVRARFSPVPGPVTVNPLRSAGSVPDRRRATRQVFAVQPGLFPLPNHRWQTQRQRRLPLRFRNQRARRRRLQCPRRTHRA